MNRSGVLSVIFAMMILGSGVASAATVTTLLGEDFEDGNLTVESDNYNGWFITQESGSTSFTADDGGVINGTYSGQFQATGADLTVVANNSTEYTGGDIDEFSFVGRPGDHTTGTSGDSGYRVSYYNMSGDQIYKFRWFVDTSSSNFPIFRINGDDKDIWSGFADWNENTNYRITVNQITESGANITINGEQNATDDDAGESLSEPPMSEVDGISKIEVHVDANQGGSSTYTFHIDDIHIEDRQVERGLDMNFRGHMDHGERQQYEVIETVEGQETDVSNVANVSSSNTTVVSVSESNTTLIATSDVSINRRVTITAEHNGSVATRNVTVANVTIDNIGIMPSPQWIPAILGIGEEGTGPGGIGSELQWLLVLVMIMYGVTYQTNSASVGIGIGVGGVIALWAAGYVSVGMLLSTMLFGSFIALTTLDLQNDQTVVHEYR